MLCQFVVLGLCILDLFHCLHEDFNGAPSTKAGGFQGGVITILATAILVAVFWGAGAFSEIF